MGAGYLLHTSWPGDVNEQLSFSLTRKTNIASCRTAGWDLGGGVEVLNDVSKIFPIKSGVSYAMVLIYD